MLLMLLAVLTGCGTREPETGKKISVYYVNTAETKVEVHDQYLNTKTPEEQLEETMTFLCRPRSAYHRLHWQNTALPSPVHRC